MLSEKEIRRAAKLQYEYEVDHPVGFKVSKQVTVVVKKNEWGETDFEAYMVSDMAQALERDGVFGESKDRKKMCVRVPKPNEMVPAIMMEGKNVTEFDQLFFIVQLTSSKTDEKKDYSILKIRDFPAYNRGPPAKPAEYKGYLAKNKGEPLDRRFADFNLLLYIAEVLDVPTAVTMAQCIANGLPLDPELVSLLN